MQYTLTVFTSSIRKELSLAIEAQGPFRHIVFWKRRLVPNSWLGWQSVSSMGRIRGLRFEHYHYAHSLSLKKTDIFPTFAISIGKIHHDSEKFVFFLCCDSSQKPTVDTLFMRRRQCLYWKTSNRKSSKEDRTITSKNDLLLASSKSYATSSMSPSKIQQTKNPARKMKLNLPKTTSVNAFVQYMCDVINGFIDSPHCAAAVLVQSMCNIVNVQSPQRSEASRTCHFETYYIVYIYRILLEY